MKQARTRANKPKDTAKQLARTKAALRTLLLSLPQAQCEGFHHTKKDRHGALDECPCVKRYDQATQEGWDILTYPPTPYTNHTPSLAERGQRPSEGHSASHCD